MTRASRKDRKVQRERVQRALDRGLPAQASEAGRPRRDATQPSLEGYASGDGTNTQAVSVQRKGWLSQWPLSMKLLGLATLVLLAISLWRTIASRPGP
jgi:hypothetical protein